MKTETRRWLRLGLRDVSATAAFASIAISGAVPTWALAAFGMSLLSSLVGIRPLSSRPTLSVVLLLLTGAALFGAAFKGAMDLIVSACTFAGLVTSHRLLSAPTTATNQQVQLTALLMLAGGAALTGELSYGACLTAFALSSTLSMSLTVIEPEGVKLESFDIRPVVSRVTLGNMAALALAVSFFVLFPRLSWNLVSRRASPGLGNTSGMSDSVRLSGAGNIKSNPRVVARIRLKPNPNVEQLDAYFPGRSFGVFDGQEWRGLSKMKPAKPSVLLVPRYPVRKSVIQSIELLPGYDAHTLIAMESPVSFGPANWYGISGSGRSQLVEVADEEVRFANAGNAFSYEATSVPSDNLPPTDTVGDETYTQLPEKFDPRITALAEQILGPERRPMQAATLLKQYLQKNYKYTLELAGAVDDPLVHFLFVRKAGHCEHFATALTLLLRSQGIHARVTAGFFGGERIGETYVLRAGDAHAWTQVFEPGRGWTTVDATPESGRRNQPGAYLSWIANLYERLEEWWRSRVVDYSFSDQVDMARALVRPPQQQKGSSAQLPPFPSFFRLLVAAALAFGVYWLVQYVARRPGRKSRHTATSFLDDIERALDRVGVQRRPNEPIEELAARLRASEHPVTPSLQPAVGAYLGARFGGRSLATSEKQTLVKSIEASASTERTTPK